MASFFEFPEGATPIMDCSGLIPTWVHHIHDLNRVEAENILNAQRKYLRRRVDDPTKWFQITELNELFKHSAHIPYLKQDLVSSQVKALLRSGAK